MDPMGNSATIGRADIVKLGALVFGNNSAQPENYLGTDFKVMDVVTDLGLTSTILEAFNMPSMKDSSLIALY